MSFADFFDINVYKYWKSADISTRALIAANLASIVLAVVFKWSLLTIFLGVWTQSVIIAFFSMFKIIFVKIKSQNKEGGLWQRIISFASLTASKIILAVFFTFIYFFFNAFFLLIFFTFYGFFALNPFSLPTAWFRQADFQSAFIIAAIFFANHLFSFFYNYLWKKEYMADENIVSYLEQPFFRIFPLLIVTALLGIAFMIFGALTIITKISFFPYIEPFVLAGFLLMKTVADVKAHIKMHANKKNNN